MDGEPRRVERRSWFVACAALGVGVAVVAVAIATLFWLLGTIGD